ncbi:MAG TPA: MBL fold metallo-hydrolase [Pyrinomonadaceae bacterium]|nr:MBL fold metallo-hydrolase [Pyrinomonadaceae bacterium]
MDNRNLYFKQNVIAEPVLNQWYAWPHLIPPASASMYIAYSHLKIMRSFVASPQVHISALKNPAMLGGPFINYDASKAGEIKALLDKTAREQAHMLELAEAIKTLDERLTNEADGYSLESHYQNVPEALKGYVELVYDLHNNPSIRFIEALLYRSKYYDPSLQKFVLFEAESDGRSFVFSTPRLKSKGHLFLDTPFDRAELDELFKMKQSPQPFGRIKELLGVPGEDEALFSTFFTEKPPAQAPPYDDKAVRVRYLGHACLLIEAPGVSILCDPVISYQSGTGIPRYTYADLPETIDYVLVTHTHQDHIMFETLLQLRHKIKTLVVPRSAGGSLADPSLKLLLKQVGFPDVREIDELETIEVNRGLITGVPFLGEHADVNIRAKMAYHISIGGTSLLIAADSNNLEPKLYEHLREFLGDVNVVFLGMECDGAPMSWLYGPLLTTSLSRKNDQSRRFDASNYERGISLIDLLNPKQVYVYAMGQEPWCTFLTSVHYTDESRPIVDSNRLVNDCVKRGIIAERLYGRKELFFGHG